MAASASSEGPAMSWRLVQGVPCPRPETAGTGSNKNPCDPHEMDKVVTDNLWIDGWMEDRTISILRENVVP